MSIYKEIADALLIVESVPNQQKREEALLQLSYSLMALSFSLLPNRSPVPQQKIAKERLALALEIVRAK